MNIYWSINIETLTYNLYLKVVIDILPGIDLPNSKYSRTEGLKKFVGISGISLSGFTVSSLSNSWCGSGSKSTGSGALGLLARFERTFSRQSEKIYTTG